MGEEKALETVGAISFGHIIELTRDIALEAARLSAELQLAMADSIILATARLHHATLWTKDAHFAEMEGVKYIR
jgi:predicted nucleic acid-binding protein